MCWMLMRLVRRFLALPGSKQQLGMSSCSSSWEALVVINHLFFLILLRDSQAVAFTSGNHWTPYGCIFDRFDASFLLSATNIFNFFLLLVLVFTSLPLSLNMKTTIKTKNASTNEEKSALDVYFFNLALIPIIA